MRIDLNKVQQRMAEKGWSQRDVAQRAKQAPQWVSWVFGKAKAGGEFQPFTVHALAKGIGLSVDEIVLPSPDTDGGKEDAA